MTLALERPLVGFNYWNFPFPVTQARTVLERVCSGSVCRVELRDASGNTALAQTADDYQPSRCHAHEERVSLVIDGQERGSLVASSHLGGQRFELSQRLTLAAAWLSDVWRVAGELDSLAGEVVHAYEELHLLYQLGEELTGQLGAAQTAGFIVENMLSTFEARSAALWLADAPEPLCEQTIPLDPDEADLKLGDPLTAPLRAGGQIIGSIEVVRLVSDPPYSSRHSKLLAAVGSLAGSALHNAQLYEEVHQREVYLGAVLNSVAEGILTLGDSGEILSCNRAAERLLGYSVEEVVGRSLPSLFTTPHDEQIQLRLSIWQSEGSVGNWGESLGIRSNGDMVPLDVVASEMVLGHQRRLIVSVRDASERKHAEEALRHQALHDALTDLPNRTLLYDRLDHALRAAKRFGTSLALLMMDLDRFKEVNDTFGHLCGDGLLQAVAQRLSGQLRGSDTIARLGGDEFAVLLSTANGVSAQGVAERLLQAMGQPFSVHGQSLHVGISIGLAVSPDHGTDAETLMRHADVAMYAAKRESLGLALYDPNQDEHSPQRITLLSDLRDAILGNELVLHYQPKVSFRTPHLPCVEALVRWEHPTRGLLPPGAFIPLAEQTGLINSLGEWVLNAALNQVRRWQEQDIHVSVAVNLSARNLLDVGLPDRVAALIRRWDVPTESLVVELTESSLMADPGRAQEALTRLRSMGVGISVDDFGTGYSSLAYLKRLPVSELKIDRTFVKDMVADEDDAAIVRSTISLGHDLGLTVVAEGIEDRNTWNSLEALGCDVAQGFYIARPMPAAELEGWLSRQVPRAS